MTRAIDFRNVSKFYSVRHERPRSWQELAGRLLRRPSTPSVEEYWILKDVSFKLTPVNATEAREMIESLHAAPLLKGARGQAGADLSALADVIQRVSLLLTDNPEIRELDVNPLFAGPQGVTAVDVRVILGGEGGG